ncbi:GIY-YIG nuclease family protein [Azospira restricta]|uniref:GIY-YIG nuclease family protein n=1 Tax=Azospira restricta TaxID=404405 RepID=A0A974PWF5_9RHOO|nr:GIY-YIG nuclease family protein [Azospira restricta]QRJ62373.1 GIY-YIG nuclease family protein [Azospira restricta]
MVIKLTRDERQFLCRYDIPLEGVLDARGQCRQEYQLVMKENGARVAITDSRCAAEGHRMRSRHGKCIQCDPSSIAFSKRYRDTGYVYLALSLSPKILIKIGSSKKKNLDLRAEELNSHKCGGRTNWKIVNAVLCLEAGRVENEIQAALKDYQVVLDYGSKSGASRELFKCHLLVAVDVFDEITGVNKAK